MRKVGGVTTAYPVGGDGDRVLLLSWALSDAARFRNVVRVDRHGAVLWRAELPGNAAHDCFVRLSRYDDLFVARTYSGCEIYLDATGHTADPAIAAE